MIIKMIKFCTYCGFPANQRDHIHPKARNNGRGDGVTVPSCFECNISLSDRPFFTVKERASFLLAYYSQRWGMSILENQAQQYRLAHLSLVVFTEYLTKTKIYTYKNHTKKCLFCNKNFQSRRINTMYCSSSCNGYAQRKSKNNSPHKA